MNKLIIICLIILSLYDKVNGQQAIIKSPSIEINLKDFLGIGCEFSLFNSDQVSQQITYIKELDNIGWVRIGIPYNLFAPNNDGFFNLDVFDPPMRQLNASGLNTIVYFTGIPTWFNNPSTSTTTYPTVDNGQTEQFGTVLTSLAKNYTFVHYWQVWDRMNDIPNGAETYNSTQYNELFKECATQFEAAGISEKLSVGSVLNFGQTTIAGLEDNMINDLISSNTYNGYPSSFQPYTKYPEGNFINDETQETYYNQTTNLVSKLKKASSNLIFSSQWGWSSSVEDGGEIQQANYTIKRLLLDTVTGLDKSFIYTISDLDSNNLFGIVNLQLGKKLVYRVLERLFQITGPTLLPSTTISSMEIIGVQPGMVILQFKKPSSNTNFLAFYKTYTTPTNGDAYSNVSYITLTGVSNGGDINNVGYLYTPINVIQSPSTASAYKIIQFKDSKSITIPVSFDLSFIEFPLPPPKNSTDSDGSNSSSKISFINSTLLFSLLSFLLLSSLL